MDDKFYDYHEPNARDCLKVAFKRAKIKNSFETALGLLLATNSFIGDTLIDKVLETEVIAKKELDEDFSFSLRKQMEEEEHVYFNKRHKELEVILESLEKSMSELIDFVKVVCEDYDMDNDLIDHESICDKLETLIEGSIWWTKN